MAIVRGIHRWPVNSPCKGPVMRKMFPFDDGMFFHHNACTTVTPRCLSVVQVTWVETGDLSSIDNAFFGGWFHNCPFDVHFRWWPNELYMTGVLVCVIMQFFSEDNFSWAKSSYSFVLHHFDDSVTASYMWETLFEFRNSVVILMMGPKRQYIVEPIHKIK